MAFPWEGQKEGQRKKEKRAKDHPYPTHHPILILHQHPISLTLSLCFREEALQQHSAVESSRARLIPADNNNGTTRRSRTREVSSRYRSPTPSTPSVSRRCPSPSISRTVTKSSQIAPKRAISAERKRPSTPPSPSRPSTPTRDTSTETQLASRKIAGSRLPEVLWPSTMRNLSVSFQSDNFSLPLPKKEKPVTHSLSDRALKPSSNVAKKQVEIPPASRKPSPERKRSPLKGKNATDQAENSKPVVGLHTRIVDQHRWPSKTGGKAFSHALTRSMDLTDKIAKISTLPNAQIGIPSTRRMSFPDGMNKPLPKSSSDLVRLVSKNNCGNMELDMPSVDDNKLQESRLHKSVSSRSIEELVSPAVRSKSLPSVESRPPSPSKASILSSTAPRGVSPSQTKSLNPTSRGASPSRVRPSSPTRQSSSSGSVLSFIADIRKGKKGSNHIEDVHQLRLLYNRYLQWRYANAQADAAVYTEKVIAEKTLINVWRNTSELWDSVTEKRIGLQQLTLKLKLYSVLNEQMVYLEDWASIEKDHTSSLSYGIEDLQASTLRLPVAKGAMADVETMKAAVYSAVDVMQAMGSSICSILSRVEGMNFLVSELADVVAQEKAMLDECETLLASTAAMQIEEYSLRTSLIQLKQTSENGQQLTGAPARLPRS